NLGQNTKGYLLHQIRFKIKHPKFLDEAKVKVFSKIEKLPTNWCGKVCIINY
ncbi:MAG: hypothetical protein H6Q15_2166, partial [Bacteroidetes bacterium]|nr:hypothetical protein [Bacteroidota bacterium]